MKMTDMRAKARAIFGPANPEPMPNQPNGAKALQERANARPIPTYKVGGSVKNPTPPQPTAAEREAERKRRESLAKAKVTQSEADTLGRAMRSEGPGYKHGGKIAKYKQGTGATKSSSGRGSEPIQNLNYNLLSGTGGGVPSGGGGFRLSPTMMRQPSSDLGRISGTAAPKGVGVKGTLRFKKGGDVQTSADTAKKLATEMGGMKKGGKAKKDGLAVMIAIGSPMKGMKGMKKPVKKMHGGRIHADGDKPVKKMGGGMMYADGGKPMMKAAGGAGKVRKGMMTPEGKIVDAMNKVRNS
jgi:hypothetical protein